MSGRVGRQISRLLAAIAHEYDRATAFNRRYGDNCQRSADDLRSGQIEHRQLALQAYADIDGGR